MTTYDDIILIINANLQSGTNITAAEHKQVEMLMADFVKSQWLTGDVKEIDCTPAYILANFESNGLGKSERLGWAICNGENLTKNRRGRVPVGYDETRTFFDSGLANGIGETGGTERHPLSVTEMPAHTHNFTRSYEDNGNVGNAIEVGSQETGLQTSTGATDRNIHNTGGNASHNNMQPYIVTLFIQKL